MAKKYKLVTTLSDGTEINAGTFEVPDASGGTLYCYTCAFVTDAGAGGIFNYFSADGNLTADDIYAAISTKILLCVASDGNSIGFVLSELTVSGYGASLGKIPSKDYLDITNYEI